MSKGSVIRYSRAAWRRNPSFRGACLLLSLPLLWEAVRILGAISPALMPSLGEILRSFTDALLTGVLLAQVGLSLAVILAGSFLAIVLAVVTMLFTSLFASLDGAVRILGSLLHPLPGIVLLPVIVLWFGIGPAAITVVIVHSVFWPVLTNVQAGYRSIPGTWRMVAHNYRITGPRYVLVIALPGTAPYLLAGVRIAWARAWRALISAEMLFGAIAATGGLGWFIHSRRVFMDSAGLFAGIVAVMIVGSMVEGLVFTAVEKRTVRKWGMST